MFSMFLVLFFWNYILQTAQLLYSDTQYLIQPHITRPELSDYLRVQLQTLFLLISVFLVPSNRHISLKTICFPKPTDDLSHRRHIRECFPSESLSVSVRLKTRYVSGYPSSEIVHDVYEV